MFSGNDRILTVRIGGELDHHTTDLIRRKIERELALKNYLDIIFDFSDLSFMDSSGIGLIMGRYKHAEKLGGRVVIASARPDIRRIIEISGLHKICACYNDTLSAELALTSANIRGNSNNIDNSGFTNGSSVADWRGQHGLEQ